MELGPLLVEPPAVDLVDDVGNAGAGLGPVASSERVLDPSQVVGELL